MRPRAAAWAKACSKGSACVALALGPLVAPLVAEAAPVSRSVTRGPLARVPLDVSSSEVSLALRGRLVDQRLVFWSCASGASLQECAARPPEEPARRLEIELPSSASPQKAKVEILKAGLGQALHIVLEGPEKPYHWLIAPTPLAGGSAALAPRLALRGSLSEQHELSELPNGELGLLTRRRACGRAQDPLVVTQIQELDFARGEFVSSLASLPFAQPKSSEPWPTEREAAETKVLGLALEPSLGSTELARESFGYGLGAETPSRQVFSFLTPRSEGTLRLELGSASGALFLGVEGILRPLAPEVVSAEEGLASFRVELAESTLGQCVTLYAEPKVTIRGLSWTVPGRPALSASKLVEGLGSQDSANYELSLLADAQAASRALAEGYSRLTPRAKERAFRVIVNLPGTLELAPLLVVRASEDELTGQAKSRLHELEPSSVRSSFTKALRESSVGDEARLARAFLDYDARAALPVVLSKIDQELGPARKNARVRRIRRSALRVLMGEALARDVALNAADKTSAFIGTLLASKEFKLWSKLELLRSVPRELSTPQLNAEFVRFRALDFRGAYLLLDQLLSRFDQLAAKAQVALTVSLQEGPPAEHAEAQRSGPELAAYQTHLLELLVELELSEATLQRFSQGARALVASPERRVREQAIRLLGARRSLYRLSEPERERLFAIVDEDAFPEVRSQAALTIGLGLHDASVELKAEGEAELARRIKRQKELKVQRALTNALGASGGPKARETLSELLLNRKTPYGVRAEAASALGQLCEMSALAELTRLALTLGERPTDEGQVELGLAAVRSVYRLQPQDAKSRLAPLGAPSVPGPIAGQVQLILESGARACSR